MAILTKQEKREIRNLMESKANEMGRELRWIKDCMNDAAQSVEDTLQANKSVIASAMTAAAAPYGVTFTAAEKKKIASLVLNLQYRREWEGAS